MKTINLTKMTDRELLDYYESLSDVDQIPAINLAHQEIKLRSNMLSMTVLEWMQVASSKEERDD